MEIKRGITETFKLPKEITLNLPLITLLGKEEMTIENHKGILVYDDNNIKVSTKIGTLIIDGKNLELKQLTGEILVILGEISNFKINS